MKKFFLSFCIFLILLGTISGEAEARPVSLAKAVQKFQCASLLSKKTPEQEQLAKLIDELVGLYQIKKLTPEDSNVQVLHSKIFFQTQKMLDAQGVKYLLENHELVISPDNPQVPLAHFAHHLSQSGLKLVYSPQKTKHHYFAPYLDTGKKFDNEVDHFLSFDTIYLDHETLMSNEPGKYLAEVVDAIHELRQQIDQKASYTYAHSQLPQGFTTELFERYQKLIPVAKYNRYGMFRQRNLLESIIDRMGEHSTVENFSTVNGREGTIVFNQETWFRGVFSNEKFENEQHLNFLKTIFFSLHMHQDIRKKILSTPIIGAYSPEMKSSFFVTPSLLKSDPSIPEAFNSLPVDYLTFIIKHYQERLKISPEQAQTLKEMSRSMMDRSHILVFTKDGWVNDLHTPSPSPYWRKRADQIEHFDIYGGAITVVSKKPEEPLPLESLNGFALERAPGEIIAEIGRLGFESNEEKTVHAAQALALYLKAKGVTKIYIEADRVRSVLFRRFGFKLERKIGNDVEFYPDREAYILSAPIDDFLTASH